MRKIILFFIAVVALNATTPTYENVTTLYVATFDRTPDVVGLKYWVNDSGFSLEDVAKSFMLQPESKAKYYPNDTLYARDFVVTVYAHVYDRYPDSWGLSYWANAIVTGGFDYVSVFILAVINGAQGSDATLLANKTKYALDAIRDQLPDEPEPDGATTCHSIGSGTVILGTGRLQTRCVYHDNGRLEYEVPLVEGKAHGTTWFWQPSGDLYMKIDNWHGETTKMRYYSLQGDNKGRMTACWNYEDGERTTSCMP